LPLAKLRLIVSVPTTAEFVTVKVTIALVAFHRIDRQAAEHPGDQPHRALPDRVAPVDFVELGGIGASESLLR